MKQANYKRVNRLKSILKLTFVFLLLVFTQVDLASGQPKKLVKKANAAAEKFSSEAKKQSSFSTKVDTVIINNQQKTFTLKMADGFSDNPFREETADRKSVV